MRTAGSLVALVLVPVWLGACATPGGGTGPAGSGGTREGLPELEGGAEMGLRRGAAWSTATVKPPYVIGPRLNLHLNHSVFGGAIDGMPVNLRVESDGISGNGPRGPVSIDIVADKEKLVIEGTWNGLRAHFEVTDQAFKGSLAVYRGREVGSEIYCQYVLDKVEADGARSGTSICSGLPEQTRLEVPAQVQKWLTRQELVVVLLALLSSPPITQLERQQ
jgi:hypothetical protein